MIDTKALREAAELALRGEWGWDTDTPYTAAANPATILSLCDEIDRLRTEADVRVTDATPPAPTVGDDLVERLKPSWDFDAALTEIVRGEDEELRGVVTRHIVASNQLRTEARSALTTLRERVARLEEALTPSADTKAAYMGEFSMGVRVSTRHEEEVRSILIPWITIKEIMAAIRARTAIGE